MSTEASFRPKYAIDVRLSGRDGNAFLILGRVASALRDEKVSEEEIGAFQSEAMAGDYAHLVRTCAKWVHVW